MKPARKLLFSALTPLIAALLCSCAEAPPASTAMVVGLMSDDMGVMLERLHITAYVDGHRTTDEVLDHLEHGDGFGPPPWYPKEIHLTPGASAKDAAVSVDIEGYLNENQYPESNFPGVDLWPGLSPDDPRYSTERPLIRRSARQRFIPGETSLLRLTLESKCSRVIFGPYLEGPVCDPSSTCIGGECRPDDADMLEPYLPAWASGVSDACKPPNAGTATLELGTGESEFAPLTNMQPLQLVTGPQGGHHLWIALRMSGLQEVGSTTSITGVQPATSLVAPTVKLGMAFSPDAGGFCKLYGIRYQLDAAGDLTPFLGKPLDITVQVTEPGGRSASAEAQIFVDPTVN